MRKRKLREMVMATSIGMLVFATVPAISCHAQEYGQEDSWATPTTSSEEPTTTPSQEEKQEEWKKIQEEEKKFTVNYTVKNEYTINMDREILSFAANDMYVAMEKKDGSPKLADFIELGQSERNTYDYEDNKLKTEKFTEWLDFSALPCNVDTFIYYCTPEDIEKAQNSGKKTVDGCKKITLKAAAKKVVPILNYASFKNTAPMILRVTDGTKNSTTDIMGDYDVLNISGNYGGVHSKSRYGIGSSQLCVSNLKMCTKVGATMEYSYIKKTTDEQVKENTFVRATKWTKLKIPKQAKAPSIKLDGAKGTVGLKKGMSYKVERGYGTNGLVTDWTSVPEKDAKGGKVSSMSAYALTGVATGSAIFGYKISACVSGTEKKPASKVATIYLDSTSKVGSYTVTADMADNGKDIATKGSVGLHFTAKISGDMGDAGGGYEYLLQDKKEITSFFGEQATKDISDAKTYKWTALKDFSKVLTYRTLKINDVKTLKDKVLFLREKGYTNKQYKYTFMPGAIYQVTFDGNTYKDIAATRCIPLPGAPGFAPQD